MKAGLLEWMFIALQIPLPIELVLKRARVYECHCAHFAAAIHLSEFANSDK